MESERMKIMNLLHGLGISSKLKGFEYLLDIIEEATKQDAFNIKMKDYYEILSVKYNSKSNSIIKCIRESIEKSWNNGDITLIENIFGYSLGYDNDFPSNSLFVNTVVQYIKTCN